MDNDSSRGSSTPYAIADYGLERDLQDGGGSGHLCFGRFCDMRVGTMIANSLNILVRVLYVILVSTSGNHFAYRVSATDYCSLAFSVLAILGASQYHFYATASAAAGLTWVFLPRLGESEVWYMFLLDCMTIYPTIVMTYELYTGVMSKEERETSTSDDAYLTNV